MITPTQLKAAGLFVFLALYGFMLYRLLRTPAEEARRASHIPLQEAPVTPREEDRHG